jgi:hypothetical protein
MARLETGDDDPAANDDGNDQANAGQRVSKAQKRRDKKAQLAKQRQEEIERQEEENLLGPRQREIDAIRC